jgi:4-hydroxybenzoyl-CoA thioesterase
VDAPTHVVDAPTHVNLAAASGEFRRPRLIRFSDCDPAGIVFYPQYFVMLNGLIEDWVNEGLGLSYHGLVAQRRIGLPTVKLDVDFRAVSRMGDAVLLGLTVLRLGSRSMTLAVRCLGAETGEVRMQMMQVIVTTSLDTHRAVAIPDDFRAAILRGAPELR